MKQRHLTVIQQLFVLLFLGNMMASIHAQSIPSKHCLEASFKAHGSDLVLNTDKEKKKQSLFIFHNISDEDVSVLHPAEDEYTDTTWGSTIKQGKYTALAVDAHNVFVTCTVKDKKLARPVACAAVLQICRYEKARFAIASWGTYWITENNRSFHDTYRAVRKKSVRIKWN